MTTESTESPTPSAATSESTAGAASTFAANSDAAATEAGESPATEAPSPLEEAKQEAARMKDQLLRTAADFDNYRKRARRDVSDAERKGRDDFLKELLPIFDNLERAISHAASHESSEVRGIVDGIQIVLRQFQDTLGRLTIMRIKTVGEVFDPAHHEAIQHLETADFPAGVVAAEVQSGYVQAERVIRPAMVVVAKAPAEASSNGSN